MRKMLLNVLLQVNIEIVCLVQFVVKSRPRSVFYFAISEGRQRQHVDGGDETVVDVISQNQLL